MPNAQSRLSDARISLIVSGDALPMEKITSVIGLEPNKIVRKGDTVFPMPLLTAGEDQWMYSIILSDPIGPDDVLQSFLSRLASVRDQLFSLAGSYQVKLRLTITSNYARMLYCLTPKTLQELTDLGLPLEVSSISWGDVPV